MHRFYIFVLLFFISACQFYTLYEPGSSKMFDRYQVASNENLNQLKADDATLWTKDGVILDVLEFWKPIKEGDKMPLVYLQSNKDNVGEFNATMTAEEIAELLENSLEATKLARAKVDNLRPSSFGSLNGYMVDLLTSSADGVDYRGNVAFAIDKEELLVIYFAAHETHYFEARKPFFDYVISTIEL